MPHKVHKMTETSLDAWEEQNADDGNFKLEQEKILRLVEDNPDQTKNQLLQIAIDEGIHINKDSNWVAPKLNVLMKKGLITRPKRVVCPITGYINFTHRAIPKRWSEQRALLLSGGIKASKLVLDWMETNSKSRPDTIHTTIMWHDESISCSCNEEYSRSPEFRCHHAKGMYEAKTGKRLGEEDWEAMYNELKIKHDQLERDIEEFKKMYS